MNRPALTILSLGIVALLCAPALAAKQCYSPAELKAEQTLRLHSELMVIAVTCHVGTQGQDLVSAYAAFTQDNIGILQDAEHTMIGFYKNRYHDDGISHLDTLRTKLSNEMGEESANDTPDLFCHQYRDRVVTLYYENPAQVQNEVRRTAAAYKPYASLCRNKKYAANTSTGRVAKQTP